MKCHRRWQRCEDASRYNSDFRASGRIKETRKLTQDEMVGLGDQAKDTSFVSKEVQFVIWHEINKITQKKFLR